jgi:hypothetical protein
MVARTLDQVEYIREIHKVRGDEDDGIRILSDGNITKMHGVVEYWVKYVIEPKNRMQEIWTESLKSWEKIDEVMVEL